MSFFLVSAELMRDVFLYVCNMNAVSAANGFSFRVMFIIDRVYGEPVSIFQFYTKKRRVG